MIESEKQIAERIKRDAEKLRSTRSGGKLLTNALKEAGIKSSSRKKGTGEVDAYTAGYIEASEKAKAEGKGKIRQTLAGLSGGSEREEQYQLATIGTKKSRERLLRPFLGSSGNVWKALFEKKGKPEEIEKAKKMFGMDEESLKKKKEEEDKKKAEKEADKNKIVGANKVILDEISSVKKLVQSLSKFILVNRGYTSEIDPKTGKILYREKKTGKMAKAEDATFARFNESKTERKTIEARQLESKTEKERAEKLEAATEEGYTPQAQIARTLKAIMKSIGKSDDPELTIHKKLDLIAQRRGGGGVSITDLLLDKALQKAIKAIQSVVTRYSMTILRTLAPLAPALAAIAGAVGITAATIGAIFSESEKRADESIKKTGEGSAEEIAALFEKTNYAGQAGEQAIYAREQLKQQAKDDPELAAKLHQADKLVVQKTGTIGGETDQDYIKQLKDEIEQDKRKGEMTPEEREQAIKDRDARWARQRAAHAAPAAEPEMDEVQVTAPSAEPEMEEVQVTAQKIKTPEPTEVQVTAQKIATPEPTEVQVTAQKVTPSAGPKFKSSGSGAISSGGLLDKAATFITSKEGLPKGGKAYWDPPGQNELVSIGYGHQIKNNEYKQGYIQAGGDQIKLQGDRGIDTKMTKDQATSLLASDLPIYQKSASDPLGEAWGKLSDEQKVALISYAYNVGSTSSLVRAGLKEAILSGDMNAAAAIIAERGIKTAGGKENKTLVERRKEEGQLFASASTITPGEMVASAVTPAPSTVGSSMSAASYDLQTTQMLAQNQPAAAAAPVVVNNVSKPQSQAPRQSLPSAATRSQDSTFGRALAKDFAHPTAFTTVSMV